MTLALASTILSSLCLALMVTFDRLMVGDCYQGKPNQAWFVSSIAGSLLGLLLTAMFWGGAVYLGHVESVTVLFDTLVALFVTKGWLMIIVGAVSVQVLLHYFRCFGEDANSAAVASWLAATPVFIFLVLFIFAAVTGVAGFVLEPIWIVGVVAATLGLVFFEHLSSGGTFNVKKKYRKELVLMLLFNTAYAILLKALLTENGASLSLTEVLALLPLYWIGFAAGTRVIFKKGEWQDFRSNWKRRLRYFAVPIIIVEVIGMLVFYFEYLGLSALDPVYVSILIGAHVILVYIFDLLLGRLRKHMIENNTRTITIMGIRLLERNLPRPTITLAQVTLEFMAIIAVVVGIGLTSLYSLI